MANVPKELSELLIEQYGADTAQKITDGFLKKRPVTFRVNTLKETVAEVTEYFEKLGVPLKKSCWNDEAFIAPSEYESVIRASSEYENGGIYLQSLSSMIPPVVLEPAAGESILDMCAAPGGKTTQMAAISRKMADITACEKNKIRAERLRFNLERQGAGRVSVLLSDARKLDDMFSFDKILLDAPCSGSGTVSPDSKDFTVELYERSRRTQKELLKKALKLLKPGGKMVYSTCSVLAGENEEVLKSVMPQFGARILKIPPERFLGVELLPTTLEGTLCICPDGLYEGFFTALIEKPKPVRG